MGFCRGGLWVAFAASGDRRNQNLHNISFHVAKQRRDVFPSVGGLGKFAGVALSESGGGVVVVVVIGVSDT